MQFSSSTFLDLPISSHGVATERLSRIRDALQEDVLAGLEQLNAGVPHRYSGIFKLDGELLQNTHMFDKLGLPRPDGLETVVLTDSFCQIVMRDGFFLTDNSGNDRRLDYSPYQNVVVSYHGVPLLDNRGELHGTLCHFDMVEQSLSDEEFSCLQEAARLFSTALSRLS